MLCIFIRIQACENERISGCLSIVTLRLLYCISQLSSANMGYFGPVEYRNVFQALEKSNKIQVTFQSVFCKTTVIKVNSLKLSAIKI